MVKVVFKQGESGNPAGRPKGAKGKLTKNLLEELLAISEKVEKHSTISQGKSIIEHFVERAYKSDPVLIAYMRKIISDRHYLTEKEEEGSVKHIVNFELIGEKPSEKINLWAEEISDVLIEAGLDETKIESIINEIERRLDLKFLNQKEED